MKITVYIGIPTLYCSGKSTITKILRTIELTAFLIFSIGLYASAAGLAQERITLSEKEVPITKIFALIKKQTGYSFLYYANILENAKRITVEVKNASLEEVLWLCFKDQPFGYEVKEKVVIVKPKQKQSESRNVETLNGNSIAFKGRVVNEDDEPIADATISIKGTLIRTTSNVNGEFILQTGSSDAIIIIITHIQYETVQKMLKGETNINVTMQIKVGSLDEAVVIGYGNTTKRLNTGSVATIKASDIDKQPINNALLALQGRLSGVFVTQQSGVPGGGVSIQVRGRNSIINGNDPLYVIDGVPYLSNMLPNLAYNILTGPNGNTGGNPLSFINVSEIESISVLKDADATSIYGSRGANGVVLITTKRGKPGKSKVDISVARGVGSINQKMKLLNTPQYLEMRREAFKNDRIIPNSSNAPDLMVWDTTRYTDWQKELIGNSANYSNFQSSLTGGSANIQYLIGAGYYKETTVFPGDFSNKKGSVHFNLASTSPNRKFSTNLSANYQVNNNNLPNVDLTNYSLTLSPNTPNLVNEDGTYNWSNNTVTDNVFAGFERTYKAKTNNLISSLKLNYFLLRGLTLSSSFGYNLMQISENSILPIHSQNPASMPTGSASFTTNNVSSWIVEPEVNYQFNKQNNKLLVLLGATLHQNKSDGNILVASGYTSDAQLLNPQSAPRLNISSIYSAVYKYNAIFARLTYNLSDKYIVNLNARRDGSSRFGDNNKFRTFGSVGITWIFSEENIVKNIVPFLSFGKLRTSFGTSGSDQIGDYRYYDLYRTAYYYTYQGIIGLAPTNLFNPDLQWEETKKTNIGLELGFLQNRLLTNFEYYNNRSSNQLLSAPLPGLTGFTTYPTNLPATIRNYGWEFSVNTVNIKSHDFQWNSAINLSLPKNKLVSFPNIETSTYKTIYVIGRPITIQKVFHFAGVNDTTGVYQFIDGKGNYTYSPDYSNDRTSIVNTAPEFYGGLTNTIKYKCFQIDFTFQYVKQKGINYLFYNLMFPGYMNNFSSEILERWQMPGDGSKIQQFAQSFVSPAFSAHLNAQQSDYAFTDASFLRLKNLSFSYTLPNKFIRQLNISNCKIYLQGQNLFTVTKYKGLDPETQTKLPPLRMLTGGINLIL